MRAVSWTGTLAGARENIDFRKAGTQVVMKIARDTGALGFQRVLAFSVFALADFALKLRRALHHPAPQ